ncbi:glycosyltransferase family 2 protein [Consotaella sp. CSK11QG-6]
MQPDVTFLIAAYNAEASLPRAIRSALDQESVDVEVIVVDDRSQDGTAAAARAIGDDRVRVIELPDNRGPGGARNAGLAEARGTFIAILDSDDDVLPGRLARIVARAEAMKADVVVDNLEVVQETTGRRETMFDEVFLAGLDEISLADFIGSNVIFRSEFNYGYMKPVFRRSFLAEHGIRYDESLRIGEDYIFLASALACGARCVVEPAAGYVYHIRSGSISRVLDLRHVANMLAADIAFENAHPLDPAAREAQRRRTRSLKRATSYLTLIQHLKGRAAFKAARVALSDPLALPLLRMPIEVRLRRLIGQTHAGL